MYKVLIIDDEEPSREAIRILGDWERHGIDEVLEASNGLEGLTLLEQHKPDLALVDMKMPEMDGLSFLQIVERDYPNLFTIVISGYNDFEYTRQAIHSRVVDYLLKPVNRGDLNHALSKATGVLAAREDSVKDDIDRNITLNMSLPKLKENIYLSLIDRTFFAGSSEAYLRLINAYDPARLFGVSVLRILNLDAVAAGRFKGEQALLHYAVANVAAEFSEESFQCFSFAHPKRERESVIIHTMTGGYPEDLTFRSARIVRRIMETLENLFGIRSAAGLCARGGPVSLLADGYAAASDALGSIDVFRVTETMLAQSPVSSSQGRETAVLSSCMPQLRSAIEAGHTVQARMLTLQLTTRLREQKPLSLRQADRLAEELAFLMEETARELGAGSPDGTGLRALGLSADYANFDDYETYLCRIAELYASRVRDMLSPERSFDVSEIKTYIEQHYYEDIKISRFTDKYYLSREYLMKLFKQQFGFGIHEYVQKVRMDKAKELLDHPGLKIQEISEMLGFKDKNYFSKAFRNYFGLSPSEYRTQSQKT